MSTLWTVLPWWTTGRLSEKRGQIHPAEDWQVFNLTTPGWRISDTTVQEKICESEGISEETDISKAVVFCSHTTM
jgi:hypothetical protein